MAAQSPEAPAPLRVTADRPDAVYALGEPISFVIERADDSAALPQSLPYRITWDGASVIKRGAIRTADLPRAATFTPDEPGFVRFEVDLHPANASKGKLQAAAAVAPDQIEPSLPVPDDFDSFWADELASLASLPNDADVTPHAEHAEGIVFKVRVAMPDGKDIHGWLLRPRGGGPFPAIMRYHGAGVYAVPPENGLDWTARGLMVLSVNPQPIPNDWPQDRYVELRTGALADYRTRGREDRRTISFREMFLRAARAVDFLAGVPEWDGRHLIAEGHSQGGGQGLAAAALNRKVTALVLSCPTHCDHSGPVIGRVAGWPEIVELRDGVPDPAQVQAARYYDGVNFASRIAVPTFLSVCFLDALCPPTGVYAAYNLLRGPKTIRHEIAVGHVHTDACKEATQKWVEECVRRP